MITLSFSSDILAVAKRMEANAVRQIPFAASRALNDTAFQTRQYLKDQMDKHYDGGATRFTKDAIYSTKTNKKDLVTVVYVGSNGTDYANRRQKYVLSTIKGGEVVPYKQGGKPFAPNKSKMRVTKVGKNMPEGYVKRNVLKPGHFIYHAVAGKPKGKNGKMPSGLYQRVGKGNRTKIKLLVAFYDDQRNKAVFPAPALAKAFAMKYFRPSLERELAKAMQSAR